MFKNFAIPDCFDIPIEVKIFLAKLWNKSYSELYDEEFFDEIHLTEGELEQDTIKLLRILEDKKREDLQSHLIYLNLSLIHISEPTRPY